MAIEEHGGHAYVGNEAWEHLFQEASEVMAGFIDRYVRTPILSVSRYETGMYATGKRIGSHLLDYSVRIDSGDIILSIDGHDHRIRRSQ